jgi:hypothetical protein
MNKIQRDDTAFFLFLFDIGEQGLKASTLKTYGKLILEGAGREGRPHNKRHVQSINIMEAEDDVAHAPDFTDNELDEIFDTLPERLLRLTFWVLRLCGCRAADGERLDGSSFRITAPQKRGWRRDTSQAAHLFPGDKEPA